MKATTKIKSEFIGFFKRQDQLAILQLINTHFWKSKIGPISSIILPLFFMIIYRIISEKNILIFSGALPTYFSFSILPLCLIALPQLMVELKTSIILRKISVSRITSLRFSSILLLYYFVILIGSTTLIILLFAIFLNKDAEKIFSSLNWGELTYSLLSIYVISLASGLLLGVLIKKNSMVQIIGFVVMMFSVVFAGQFIPITVIAKTASLRYISLFSPISYALAQLNNICLPDYKDLIINYPNVSPELEDKISIIKNYNYNGLFDLSSDFLNFDYSMNKQHEIIKIEIINIYYIWQNALNLIMPWVFSIMFFIIGIKKFNWSSR